jgi:hypothetical protein
MAEVALTVQEVTKAGAALTYANANTSDGNEFANDGKTYLAMYNNGSTGTATVTIATGATVAGYALGDQTVSLSTTQIKIAGPFPPEVFNDSAGVINLAITGTGAADVDLAAFR